MKQTLKIFFPIVLIVLMFVDTAMAARIKDLSSIKGVRNNQLIGFGLVIGLAGTGDSAINVFFSIQSVFNMLTKMGVTIPAGKIERLQFKNVATVMVTAELPSFARQGDRIDVTVSSVGDSKSLQGGTLLMTPLKGPDSNTYGVAQGPLSIGGFPVAGGGAGAQQNHKTVGRVANGALVEKELPHKFNAKGKLIFALKKTDFTTARRISQAINNELKDQSAFVMDGRTIKVEVPKYYLNNTSELIARIETLNVEPDIVARVIVDERTGTVVMGENVRISTVAVAHGSLFIQIKGEPAVDDDPPPVAEPGSVNPVRTPVPIQEGEDKLLVMSKGASLGDIVNGLNAIGVIPRDLIAILQSIKAAGALHAELVVI
ncbi:MAG: flagellar basal body P-ring protein FlgI [Nitrospinaceae bacterium]|nr:flagellar basal body P-ring protein FlgI [Nitrospinaceae bacterium]